MVHSISEWFPDRPPERWEIIVVLFSGLAITPDFSSLDTISFGWVAVGFVLTGIALGPAGTTSFGQRFGRWFRDIGGTGRISAIIFFAIVVSVTFAAVDVPISLVDSFVAGMWVSLILYLLGHFVKSREIDGWRTG